MIYENDCGGTTVTTPDTMAFMQMLDVVYFGGTSYFFDARGELVGGSSWSDAIDPDCPSPPFYGKECRKTNAGELQDCE